MTPPHTTENANRVPIDIISVSVSRGKLNATKQDIAPVIKVPYTGVPVLALIFENIGNINPLKS